MSETYEPPFPPAEMEFTNENKPGRELYDRHFIVFDSERGEYWRNGSSNQPSGYTAFREEAGCWTGLHMKTWGFGSVTRIEMLPIKNPIPTEPNEADRDIKWGELGKVGDQRACIIKDKEGKYLDGNLKEVAERKLAPVLKCCRLFGLPTLQSYVFELLKPLNADTGGPEMQEIICFAEAQRQEGNARFLVKSVKADEVNGYTYFYAPSIKAKRELCVPINQKELRRLYDEVPKVEIIIELLKPMPVSKMSDFFNPSAIDLIKAAPKNEQLRGFMLSKLKVMPPEELDTYDKLKEWIEWNVDKNAAKPKREKPLSEYATAPATATVESISMSIPIVRKRTIYGSARYYVQQSGRQNAELSMAQIREEANEAEDWSEFRDYIRNVAGDGDDSVNYEDIDSKHYENYEQDDTDHRETAWPNIANADEIIKTFLRQHMPDVLTKFGAR